MESTPEFEFLQYSADGPVARITLNRPEKRNALSMALSDELIKAIDLVQQSPAVKVLVIRGAGDTFCAGDDISEMHLWGDANGVTRRVRLYQRMANALEELDGGSGHAGILWRGRTGRLRLDANCPAGRRAVHQPPELPKLQTCLARFIQSAHHRR